MDKTEQAIFDEELREKEIKRLTSPLKYNYTGPFLTSVTDIEGNVIKPMRNAGNYFDKTYILEPKRGILTDDEILKYAGNSKTAAEIRLKRGMNNFSDKKLLFWDRSIVVIIIIAIYDALFTIFTLFAKSYIAFIIGLSILLLLSYYVVNKFFLKDYTSKEYNNVPKFIADESEPKITEERKEVEKVYITNSQTLKRYESQVNNLKQLYEVKEKVAIDMIEKRFSPTEMTYEKFMSTLKSCSNLFYEQAESALNIINFSTDNSPKVEYEIKNRIDILKLIIEKVDELTNELVLNMSSLDSDSDEIRYLVEDMEKLIKSVKDYK